MIKTEKADTRKKLKEKVKNLPSDYCRKADKSIVTRVINLPEYRNSRTVFCYVGTADEINTMPLLLDALKKGKRVGVPRCLGKGIMKVFEIQSLYDLEKGSFGILEPKEDCKVIEPDEIDMGCIPCLSCTRTGIRLGYGGGFYDRYLTGTSFPRVILCREQLISDELPVEEHDQRMDVVVTEKETIRCAADSE